eukprot:9143093-Heterocapsa_arctica.AAC.1
MSRHAVHMAYLLIEGKLERRGRFGPPPSVDAARNPCVSARVIIHSSIALARSGGSGGLSHQNNQ